MFGKHALEIRVKKDDAATLTDTEKPSVTPDDIAHVAKKVITYVAVGLIGSFAAASVLNTASEITVHKFTSEPEKD